MESSTPTPVGGGSLRAFRRAYLIGCFLCILLVSNKCICVCRKIVLTYLIAYLLRLCITSPTNPESNLSKQNAAQKSLSTWDPHGHQKPSKWSPKAPKIEPQIDQKFEKSFPAPPKWSQEGARTAKRSKIKTDLTNKWGNSYRGAPF